MRFLKRVRGAIVLGLIWGIGWGIIGGGIMETIFDPHGRIADIWPMIFAIPGFLGGVLFSVVFAIGERNRRFDELSVRRFGTWGAVAGALLTVPATALLGLGPWISIPLTLLGAASAAGSLVLARRADNRQRLHAGRIDAGALE